MGQNFSSSTNNQDQDGDVIMVDDSETNVEDANGSEYTHNSQTGTTSLRRPRPHSNVVISEDRNPLQQSSTLAQNGSPRVLRMTPARRRRQLSSLYPFFPSATTTNQTQVPLSRPLTRLQRLHHNSVDDVSLTPRQTDTIAPNMLRRSRTRSSSYNGHDTDAMNGLEANSSSNRHSLPTVETTMFDVRRPRSNSVDVILNSNLGDDIMRSNLRISDRPRRSSTNRGSSSRPYSSYTSLSNASDTSTNSSTAGTQTDSSTASPQRLRRRLTRISARRLFNVGPDSESNNTNNNNEDNDAENQVLGRLLSMAAAATARSLVESQENAVIEAERAASEGHDGSFESFLAALQRRRREATNRPPNQTTSSSTSEEQVSSDGNTPNPQSSQPMSFFRLFRFGGPRTSPSQQNSSTETTSDQSSSTTVNESPNNENNGPHMVPVIIIGIRSVPPREDPTSNLPPSQQPEINSSTTDTRNSPGNRSTRTRSSSTSNRTVSGSTASTGTQTPPARSWIIYVLGGTYPSTHPLLTTPSLFSDNPTYEDMVLLSSLIGPARPPTTTQSEIDANLPVALYNESIRGLSEYTLLGNAEKCQVCLCDYVTDEEVRVLNCRHGFHRECIDKWLTEGSNKCPICRGIGVPSRENEVNNNNAIPTPTPGLGPMGHFF